MNFDGLKRKIENKDQLIYKKEKGLDLLEKKPSIKKTIIETIIDTHIGERPDVYYQNFHIEVSNFLCLKNNTKGAAQTINIALKNLNIPDEPVLCLDGDNFYKCDIIKLWNMKNMIITVEDFNEKPIYSYVLANKNVVKDIVFVNNSVFYIPCLVCMICKQYSSEIKFI